MSLANWDVTKSHASLTVAIENDRLKLDNDVVKATVIENYMHFRKNSDFSRGHLIGKIRTKMEVTDQNFSGSSEAMYGIIAMMSQDDLTGGAGSAYCFGLRAHFDLEWLLLKFDGNGMENYQSATTLASGSTELTPALDTNYTLELTWAYHALIGGTNLVCKVGLAENNFTDLVTVYDATDTSTPLTTSVGEGLFYADMDTGISDLKRVYFDDTTIITLAGIPL